MESSSFLGQRAGALLGLALLFAPATGVPADDPPASAFANRFRQPVALALVDDGASLLVANRRSGSISVIDVASARTVTEWNLGCGLADLAPLPGGRHLLAVDQDANALLLLFLDGRSIRLVDRLAVSADPVRVVILAGGSSCLVASRWSRRLTFVDIVSGSGEGVHPTLRAAHTLDLPFSPRELILIGNRSTVVVADAFGGRLAVVDTRLRSLQSVRSLPAHNIRGLALAPDGQTLAVAHQVLSRLATTSFDDVHWGALLSNHLRLLRTDALLVPDADASPLRGSRLIDLGGAEHGAGDPGGLALSARGELIVSLSGVGEVAVGPAVDRPGRRVAVGRRPTAVLPAQQGSTAFVADTLDDTVAVIDVTSGVLLRTIPLGPRPELNAAERGERLFYDARLSHDGWLSCNSCHTDGHTNGGLADTLGDGSYGAPKLVPSLLGVGGTGPWGWLGNFERLEDQVRQSIETTMRGKPPTDDQVADLSAYLRAFEPPAPAVPPTDLAAARGANVFRARDCARCHTAPNYTSKGRYDIGLSDEVGHTRFNPPSLRGAGQRDRFLHDGRASTLEEVFRPQVHPRGTSLEPGDVEDLVAFLKTL